MPEITIADPEAYPFEMPRIMARFAEEHGPIFRRRPPPQMAAYLGPWIVYMVGPEANRFVLHTRREAFSHDRGWTPQLTPVFERGLLNTDEPAHAQQRRMMNPAFAIAYMSRYLPIMNRVVADRSRDWVQRGDVDIYAEARKITFDIAAEALVGIHTGPETDRLRELFFNLLYGEFDPLNPNDYAFFEAIKRDLNTLLLAMIATRRQTPTDDILGLLVQARGEDGTAFSDEELLGQVQILLVAGHETTTTLSSWVLYQLATHDAIRTRVLREITDALAISQGEITLDAVRAMPYLGHVIDETGRLYGPVGFAPRGALTDFDFGGYRVPAGTQIRLGLMAGHQLPSVFAEPQRFDPERFEAPREEDKKTPYSLVTFGGGPRVCIGINFAQVEIKAIIAQLLPIYQFTPLPDQVPVMGYYGLLGTIPNGMLLRVTSP